MLEDYYDEILFDFASRNERYVNPNSYVIGVCSMYRLGKLGNVQLQGQGSKSNNEDLKQKYLKI